MTIPTPERGQPIDVVYLYNLTKAINAISAKVLDTTYNYATIYTPNAGYQSVPTSQVMIHASTVAIPSGTQVSPTTIIQWSEKFNVSFADVPNVTCSIIVLEGTTGNDAIVTITNVTKEMVTGQIKFLSQGSANISVNVQAIGIPA